MNDGPRMPTAYHPQPPAATPLYGILAVAILIGVIAVSGGIVNYTRERSDVHSLACDNAVSLYTQYEFLKLRARENLTHSPQAVVEEAISFYDQAEAIIPISRCGLSQAEIRKKANETIQSAINDP